MDWPADVDAIAYKFVDWARQNGVPELRLRIFGFLLAKTKAAARKITSQDIWVGLPETVEQLKTKDAIRQELYRLNIDLDAFYSKDEASKTFRLEVNRDGSRLIAWSEMSRIAPPPPPPPPSPPQTRWRWMMLAAATGLAIAVSVFVLWPKKTVKTVRPMTIFYLDMSRDLAGYFVPIPRKSQLRIDGNVMNTERYILSIDGFGKAKIYSKQELAAAKWGWEVDGPPPSQTLLLLTGNRDLTAVETAALVTDISSLGIRPDLDASAQIWWKDGRYEILRSADSARGPKAPEPPWPKRVENVLMQDGHGLSIYGVTFPVRETN